MRTAEERIRILHSRANELKKRTDRRSLFLTGGVSVCLFVLLFIVLVQANSLAGLAEVRQFAGSSMLKESTGGYVLVAVVSFVAAVAVTLVCIYFGNKKHKESVSSDGAQNDGRNEE